MDFDIRFGVEKIIVEYEDVRAAVPACVRTRAFENF
jgi:hypothetical protein